MRKLLGLGALLTLACAAMVAAPSAGSYGKDAVYQITFSLNCTSVTPGACDQFGGPGGVWGWIELDAGGTGDMTLTLCGHTIGGGGADGRAAVRTGDGIGDSFGPGSLQPASVSGTRGRDHCRKDPESLRGIRTCWG